MTRRPWDIPRPRPAKPRPRQPNRSQQRQASNASAWRNRHRRRSVSAQDYLGARAQVMLTEGELRDCRAAAARSDLSLSAWARKHLLEHIAVCGECAGDPAGVSMTDEDAAKAKPPNPPKPPKTIILNLTHQ